MWVSAVSHLHKLFESDPSPCFGSNGVFLFKHDAISYTISDHGEVNFGYYQGKGLVCECVGIIGGEVRAYRGPYVVISDEALRQASELTQTILYSAIMFERYAELKTKHLRPGQRIVDIDCKYINATPHPLTVMDSTWFTTLVKSDAFKVSGHFRLQPCGEGAKDRKLIWVNDFMKTGYTAPARKAAVV